MKVEDWIEPYGHSAKYKDQVGLICYWMEIMAWGIRQETLCGIYREQEIVHDAGF